MWTDAHQARHEAGVKEMVMRESVEEMARWLERADPSASNEATDDTWVVAGIAWHLHVGGGWRALPGEFPRWRTVYGWFRRWCEKGLFDRYMQEVARQRRRAAGRRPTPRLGIIDTQAVKCIPVHRRLSTHPASAEYAASWPVPKLCNRAPDDHITPEPKKSLNK
jgi:putative transposase